MRSLLGTDVFEVPVGQTASSNWRLLCVFEV